MADSRQIQNPVAAAAQLVHQHRRGVRAQTADVVGIYLDPLENALVLSVDEKPHIQALERAQGFLRLPDGKAVDGFSHCYKAPRHHYPFCGSEHRDRRSENWPLRAPLPSRVSGLYEWNRGRQPRPADPSGAGQS